MPPFVFFCVVQQIQIPEDEVFVLDHNSTSAYVYGLMRFRACVTALIRATVIFCFCFRFRYISTRFCFLTENGFSSFSSKFFSQGGEWIGISFFFEVLFPPTENEPVPWV